MSGPELTEEMKEMIAEATPDSPCFERVGTSENGNPLYEMNAFDVLVYIEGLKAMKERAQE